MYGRARRLQVLKIALLVIGIIVTIIVSFTFFMKIFNKKDDNFEFSYLRNYLTSKGYSCELLKYDGSMCKYKSDVTYNSFIRYNTGFEYLIKTDNYTLVLHHVDGVDKFTFRTTVDALPGYRGKEYECTYKDSLIGEFNECKDINDESILDLNAYIGSIENSMKDLSLILKSSGYNVDKLMKDYVWTKK